MQYIIFMKYKSEIHLKFWFYFYGSLFASFSAFFFNFVLFLTHLKL